MPLLSSNYDVPPGLGNGHLQTILPKFFRRIEGPPYERERIETEDGDFLDLDWTQTREANRVAIISHGLEGSSKAHYVRGLGRALAGAGWDVCAWNYRGCSGEPNRLLRSYHSGDTPDLDRVVRHALDQHGYDRAMLAGFSLGGNLTLKYMGERGAEVDGRITHAAAFSVPCDLQAGSHHLADWRNWIYMRYFLRSLYAKMVAKEARYPDEICASDFRGMRTFQEFDGRYTAPVHGFESAEDYWTRASCKSFLPGIRRPTLLLSAEDDPFLPEVCYPTDEAEANPDLFLEMPEGGGHCGFIELRGDGLFYNERRTLAFLEEDGPARMLEEDDVAVAGS